MWHLKCQFCWEDRLLTLDGLALACLSTFLYTCHVLFIYVICLTPLCLCVVSPGWAVYCRSCPIKFYWTNFNKRKCREMHNVLQENLFKTVKHFGIQKVSDFYSALRARHLYIDFSTLSSVYSPFNPGSERESLSNLVCPTIQCETWDSNLYLLTPEPTRQVIFGYLKSTPSACIF